MKAVGTNELLQIAPKVLPKTLLFLSRIRAELESVVAYNDESHQQMNVLDLATGL